MVWWGEILSHCGGANGGLDYQDGRAALCPSCELKKLFCKVGNGNRD
jgi:hypothetical protein